jgi:alkylation response protein AidB-like acyl-CoA dehydrogenase
MAVKDRATCTGLDDFLYPHHLISPEAKQFCQTIRKFSNNELIPHEEDVDEYWDWTERTENTFVNEMWRKLFIDVGLQQSFLPPELGGTGGGSTVEACAMVSELSRGDFGVACSGFISSWALATLVMPKPNEVMLKKVAPLICGSEPYMICSAITEPHAGGSVEDLRLKGSQIRTKARLEGDEWVINGHKLWPSAYREAQMFRVLCVVEGEEYPYNIAQIFVPAGTPGLATSKPYQKMGAHLDTNGDIWFDNVRVPKENRAQSEPGDDAVSVLGNITVGRLTSAAFPMGIMKRAYEVFKAYVEHREIAGMPMKEHGVVVHELGMIAREILTAEAMLYSVAERMDHPEVYGPPWEVKNMVLASACQNTVSDLGWSVVNRCLDMMGSYGYSREGKMQKLLRDLKITQIIVGGQLLRLTELARYYFGTKTI